MLIAKIINGEVVQVEDYRSMFPGMSFPQSGPTPEQMQELGCMHVNLWKEYDAETETLQSSSPYIEGNSVYLVTVRDLTQEELNARTESRKALNQSRAANLLRDSDYLVGRDVQSLITNNTEILAYRAALRAIALNPPEIVETWPIKPKTEWVV